MKALDLISWVILYASVIFMIMFFIDWYLCSRKIKKLIKRILSKQL
jgi:hypothetical protein